MLNMPDKILRPQGDMREQINAAWEAYEDLWEYVFQVAEQFNLLEERSNK